jgi:hypothetical protein
MRAGDTDQITELRSRLKLLGWVADHESLIPRPEIEVSQCRPDTLGLSLWGSSQAKPTCENRRARRARRAKAPANARAFWDQADIAEQAGVSLRHVERLRQTGRLPAPSARLGRRLLWSRDAILSFLAKGGTA